MIMARALRALLAHLACLWCSLISFFSMLIAEACSRWRTEVDNYLDNAVDIAVSCVVTFCHYLLQRCARSQSRQSRPGSQSLHISRSRLSGCLGSLPSSVRRTHLLLDIRLHVGSRCSRLYLRRRSVRRSYIRYRYRSLVHRPQYPDSCDTYCAGDSYYCCPE